MNFISLFSTWKYWIIACAVMFAAGFGMGWHEKALRIPALLEEQQAVDIAQCSIEKETTRRANDKLQTDRDRIAADAARYKRLHPVSCVIPTRRPELLSGGAEHAGGNGAVAGSTDDFRDYAATCERYRSEVSACINFLSDERTAK